MTPRTKILDAEFAPQGIRRAPLDYEVLERSCTKSVADMPQEQEPINFSRVKIKSSDNVLFLGKSE